MVASLIKNPIVLRSATLEDRRQLANLIHFETHVHRHLDWRAPLEWIGFSPYLVLEQRNKIIAALACPPDPPEVAWIRLFAVTQTASVESTWNDLWAGVMDQLTQVSQVQWVMAIPLWPWFSELLKHSGFVDANRVLMLSWEPGRINLTPPSGNGVIRPMNYDDIPAVTRVDQLSFEPDWRNSRENIELAFRQASLATVVEDKGQIVGYQISTTTPAGGHLARLAVLPRQQGKGIGYILVHDLLTQLERRGARQITVNTQADNKASLRLYNKAGFHLTGEDYPVMRYKVHGNFSAGTVALQ